MARNYPILLTNSKPQIKEPQKTPISINKLHKHIIFIMLKTKDQEKILKAVSKKRHITYRTLKVIIIHFSLQIIQSRRQ